MKKRVAVVLVLAVALVAVLAVAQACGSSEGGTSTPTASATPTMTPSETASPSPTATALDGQQLVAERCDPCHGSPDRIASKKWTKAQWTQEVTDMIAEQGAKLNAEEKTVVIDYLAATYGP